MLTRARSWTRRQDWNPVRRARGWYEASEWSRMGGKDLAWHVWTWAVSLFCVLVVVVTYFRALEMWPRPMRVVTLAAVVAATWERFGYRRGLRGTEEMSDRLGYAELHYEATTNSYARELLAEGPITDPTPVVTMFDQDAPTVSAEVG